MGHSWANAGPMTAEFRQEERAEVTRNDTLHESVLNADTMAAACDHSRGGRNAALGYLEARESPDACEQEELVVDDRATLRPAQVVESKLTKILQAASLPVSYLQMRSLLRIR